GRGPVCFLLPRAGARTILFSSQSRIIRNANLPVIRYYANAPTWRSWPKPRNMGHLPWRTSGTNRGAPTRASGFRGGIFFGAQKLLLGNGLIGWLCQFQNIVDDLVLEQWGAQFVQRSGGLLVIFVDEFFLAWIAPRLLH